MKSNGTVLSITNNSEDSRLTIHSEDRTTAITHKHGLTITDGGGVKRGWIEYDAGAKAEVGVHQENGVVTGLLSQPGQGGLLIGDDIGIMKSKETRVLYMGDAPPRVPDWSAIEGIYLVSSPRTAAQMRLQSGDGPHLLLQDTPDLGSGLKAGGRKGAGTVKVGISNTGVPSIKILDADGNTIMDTDIR